ncbi:hypothetical protein CEUSTIGMA_g377.t1 [Chlamydomonas eustigma]|uniref:Uncharacterized protein n=1 Tax=Chlamydomonas eustigma TaxID=1157962 RepID=A0A250WQI2_9CHLO|nr:hypothetical protein CEUSTIGMA_g377.t1 [Chlamydomonas eustigma]|eukprot:GAX72922.1 hypothetical protein CEUSTIGMA_g377.t1 [Chlamydomonas eustigma]
MAIISALRSMANLPRSGSTSVSTSSTFSKLFVAGYATETSLSAKDVAYLLDNRDDPEVDAAIKAYLKVQFSGGKDTSSTSTEHFELASKVEKKYVAAQVISQGVLNVALPLSYDGKDFAPVKRYVSELTKLASKAGFEDATVEVEKQLAQKAKTAESLKDFLGRIQSLTSPEFHAALSEALVQVETETNSAVSLDASSEGYKKFAAKVQAIATAHKMPWKVLVDAKKPATSSDDAVKKAYQSWVQSARLADAVAEIDVLKTEATTLLDKHLTKTAETVKKEQESSLASLQKKLEASKGAAWAAKFQEDLKNIKWFDAAVAANPSSGPKATA